MLKLNAYSGRDRQHALQIMRQCQAEGLTLDECISAVVSKAVTEKEPTPESNLCPSCGRAQMRKPKRKKDDPPLPVLVCPECRYSVYREVV